MEATDVIADVIAAAAAAAAAVGDDTAAGLGDGPVAAGGGVDAGTRRDGRRHLNWGWGSRWGWGRGR